MSSDRPITAKFGPRICRRALAAAVAIVLAAMTTPIALTTTARADEISDKKTEAQQIAGQIYDLNVKIEEYAEAANGAMVQLAQLVQQIAAAQVKVDQAQAEQELHRRELQAYAVDAYVYGKPPEQVDVNI